MNDNSLTAYRNMPEAIKEADKHVILGLLRTGNYTCVEIEARTCRKHQTISARIYDLMRQQKIKIVNTIDNQSVYALRSESDPLNIFKKTPSEKLKFLESILSEDQKKLLRKFEKG